MSMGLSDSIYCPFGPGSDEKVRGNTSHRCLILPYYDANHYVGDINPIDTYIRYIITFEYYFVFEDTYHMFYVIDNYDYISRTHSHSYQYSKSLKVQDCLH